MREPKEVRFGSGSGKSVKRLSKALTPRMPVSTPFGGVLKYTNGTREIAIDRRREAQDLERDLRYNELSGKRKSVLFDR